MSWDKGAAVETKECLILLWGLRTLLCLICEAAAAGFWCSESFQRSLGTSGGDVRCKKLLQGLQPVPSGAVSHLEIVLGTPSCPVCHPHT